MSNAPRHISNFGFCRNVFRILSLLNKEFHENKAIGLISLDRKIIEKNNDTENDKENDNEQTKEKRLFKTLENKIIYQNIIDHQTHLLYCSNL